ncbi:MAG TPA: hypothetical protein VLM40_07515 [Gemmata sp.]|nr:hypothetical protein [Gemmata sp.]
MATFRAPAGNGEVLAVPDFAAIPALVEENRRRLDRDDLTIGGMTLRELRAQARREVLQRANRHASAAQESDAPLLLTGHQPELSHPGVWVKNFALCGLARKLGGTALHLVVDNDTLKSTSLRFPHFSDRDSKSVRLESIAFDRLDGEVPYEDRAIHDVEQFRSFPERVAALKANWGYEPLIARVWKPAANVGEAFTAMRRRKECEWGCDNLELPVSRLAATGTFHCFANHILGDLPRFREVYNAAVLAYRGANHIRSDNHPAPELAEGEAPFWVHTATGRRERATAESDVRNLRPRAFTLTLFARLCLGDFFIHGIGGGMYDQVTDAIIRDYFGIEPPAYQVLSATLHLPLPGFPATTDDLKRAEHLVRDLHWNPQRHLPHGVATELVVRKRALAAAEPPYADHRARRDWFRALQKVTEELLPFVADQIENANAERDLIAKEAAANAILQRRDFAWVLYPEEVLRPFLQQFLFL